MLTAKEAKRQSDKAIDKIITKEVPDLLRRIEEVIDISCQFGKYSCIIECYDYCRESVDNVALQLVEAGYNYSYSLASKNLMVSW